MDEKQTNEELALRLSWSPPARDDGEGTQTNAWFERVIAVVKREREFRGLLEEIHHSLSVEQVNGDTRWDEFLEKTEAALKGGTDAEEGD